MRQEAVNLGHVGSRGVDDRVRAGVVSVGGLDAVAVVLCDNTDNGAGDIVHVKDGWVGIQAHGVELVRVTHGQLGKLGEVLVLDSINHLIHALGDHVLNALLQQGRGLDGQLHALGRGGALLLVGDDANQGLEIGPVGLGRDLDSLRVGAVGAFAHLPGDKAAKEGTAGRTGALAGNDRQVRGIEGQLEELGQSVDQASVARSRRGQASGGGEVVLGADVDVEVGELGGRGILGLDLGAQGTGLAETSDKALVGGDGLLNAVEPEAVRSEIGRGADGGLGVELVLGKGDREGGVGRENQGGVALAPVLDHGDVDGCGAGGFKGHTVSVVGREGRGGDGDDGEE